MSILPVDMLTCMIQNKYFCVKGILYISVSIISVELLILMVYKTNFQSGQTI